MVICPLEVTFEDPTNVKSGINTKNNKNDKIYKVNGLIDKIDKNDKK